MMGFMTRLTLGVLTVALIQGCAFNVNRYGASVENVEAIKLAAEGQRIAVREFTSYKPGMDSITCRAAGGVKTNDGGSFEAYLQKAFIDELRLAGVYDQNADIVLSGYVEELDFSSNIGAGRWKMSLAIAREAREGYSVSSVYEFSTNYVADKACQQVAQAFVPAVQKLIGTLVTDPRFSGVVN
jgi:hypothetical protein